MRRDRFVCPSFNLRTGSQPLEPIKVRLSLSYQLTLSNPLPIFSIVIQALIALVNDPEPEHPLRTDLAEEYCKDRKKFFKIAEEYTKKFSEKRPSD